MLIPHRAQLFQECTGAFEIRMKTALREQNAFINHRRSWISIQNNPGPMLHFFFYFMFAIRQLFDAQLLCSHSSWHICSTFLSCFPQARMLPWVSRSDLGSDNSPPVGKCNLGTCAFSFHILRSFCGKEISQNNQKNNMSQFHFLSMKRNILYKSIYSVKTAG